MAAQRYNFRRQASMQRMRNATMDNLYRMLYK